MQSGRSEANGTEKEDDGGRYEFRAGAVFYGGVSLAIYENGVARAFYDAATAAGLFAPLLDLIETRFVVDVVSGSSAGGINGLLLAAALERGYPFAETAELWREHGGIEDLLRPASEAGAPSLLRGETYYLTQLREAFRKICCHDTPPGYEPPLEVDVFVTGTNLGGAVQCFEDAFGKQVPTRTHRLMFHLQHRQGRKDLGYLRQDPTPSAPPGHLSETTTASAPDERELQADILASVARITSSFPGAFPPFTPREFDDESAEGNGRTHTTRAVRHALGRLSGQDLSHDPQLIDGGVLDNRPFAPLLDAVFHRMPARETRGVTRRVFYVDPDPEVFKKQRTKEFTPLAVAVNSIVALPSYDSITSDVKDVATHNSRMAHLREMRKRLASASSADEDSLIYRYALEREVMALLNGSEVPSPRDPDGDDQNTLEEVAKEAKALRRVDISFHLRRAISLFYGYASATGTPAVDSVVQPEQCYAVGRVVKALKLLRDVWVSELRERQKAGKLPPIRHRLQVLETYLSGSWIQPRVTELSAEELHSERLSEVATQARATLRTLFAQTPAATGAEPALSPAQLPPARPSDALPGLLELLEQCLRKVLPGSPALEEFARKDSALYPLELASGTYELDEVGIIRVSPNDPELPKTASGHRISGHSKLTGDELAHFSAFLRRDFRTNDVAWGHVDALDRLVRALLDDRARDRASRRLEAAAAFFTVPALVARTEACGIPIPAPLRATLELALERLHAAFEACRGEAAALSAPTWQSFIDAFIHAAQTAAACEYIDLIREDAATQDRAFNWQEVPALRRRGASALEQLVALRRGETPVLQALPPSVVVEYVARAGLLLWGMIEASSKAKALARARPYVVAPLSILHTVAVLVRTEKRVAALLVFGTFMASVTLIVATFFGAALKLIAVGLLGVAFCVLCTGFVRSLEWLRTLKLAAKLVVAAAAAGLVFTSHVAVRLPWGHKTYTHNVDFGDPSDTATAARSPAPAALQWAVEQSSGRATSPPHQP